MRKLALSVAAILVLAVVSPAFAQPFADVPTDHWAFDAIAELAAKGIIEGFPDGTFKGDRGVTRYEVAMIVARILARIEAIKIPAPAAPAPAPQVTRADVQTIQRLVNEFRAELAALGVRVTAVEEELTALKGAADKTNITGNWTWVSTFNSGAAAAVARNRARLTFKGSVGGGTAVFLRARWNAVSPGTNTTDFDKVYFDFPAFGLSFRVGRDYWSLGDNAILLSSAETAGARDAVRVMGSFGGFSFTGLGYFNGTSDSATTYGARVEMGLAGWAIGVNYRDDRDWSGGGFVGNGYSADFSGGLFPGFTLSGEYASYTPSGAAAATAYKVNVAIDLGGMGMMSGWSPTANVWYKDYKAGYPVQDTNIYDLGGFWKGADLRRVTGFGADLSLQVGDKLSVKLGYESGTENVSATSYTAYLVGTEYTLAANTVFGLEYMSGTGAFTDPGYAAYLTYKW